MRRNPQLSLRKPQGLAKNCAKGMNRGEVDQYFRLLRDVLVKNNLIDKPSCIFNMDETGLQLNNDPQEVVAGTGSRNVHTITEKERGESVTVIACFNAEGSFLPPYCIFKGVYEVAAHKKDLPPGSVIKMNKKSAYSNSEIFMDWLQNHFVPRKPPGRVLLILDGHISHMNSLEMLKFAEEQQIILFCLPSHTTAWLQPLDVAVFKPLKSFWRDTVNVAVDNKKSINRSTFGDLLSTAWKKSATLQNGQSGFRATGIFPYDPNVIPEQAFLTCVRENQTPLSGSTGSPPSSVGSSSTSISIPDSNEITPTKMLDRIHEVPTLDPPVRKREKQHAMVVTMDKVKQKVSFFSLLTHSKNCNILNGHSIFQAESKSKKSLFSKGDGSEINNDPQPLPSKLRKKKVTMPAFFDISN
jgi:hypothetical protein